MSLDKLPKVTKVVQKMNNGYTCPFVVKCDADNNLYVIKATSKKTENSDEIISKALFNELICARFAKQLHLDIPDFSLLNLPQEVIEDNYEMKNSGLNSGICFASKYKKAEMLTISYLDISVNKELMIKMILFDQIIFNNDRANKPDNVLFDRSLKKLYIIDHTEAFINAQIWTPNDLKQRVDNEPPSLANTEGICYKIISRLKNKDKMFKNAKKAYKDIDYDLLFNDIPSTWKISEEDVNAAKSFLKHRVNQIDDIINEVEKRV